MKNVNFAVIGCGLMGREFASVSMRWLHLLGDLPRPVILAACAMAGIPAEKSGRNDLLAEGRKFSGNAFYHSKGFSYHHGTLLIDTDMNRLGRYLSPPKAKLESKGVTSVRSRVVNLKELSPTLTCAKMKEYMTRALEAVYGQKALLLPVYQSF